MFNVCLHTHGLFAFHDEKYDWMYDWFLFFCVAVSCAIMSVLIPWYVFRLLSLVLCDLDMSMSNKNCCTFVNDAVHVCFFFWPGIFFLVCFWFLVV